MTRYKLVVEYDGAGFVGWQRQDNGPSIQQSLEEAVHGFCGETVIVQGAGRTDAGVHALGQVAHIDIDKATRADVVRDAINAHLRPNAIAVLTAEEVSEDFHARFSAVERAYEYRIANRRPPPTLDAGRVWHVNQPLNAAAMHEAAQELVGKHDFTSFRASLCQARSPVKTLTALAVTRQGEDVVLQVRAPSFLHHQVRNFAGTLKMVGEGKWSAQDVAKALAAKDRAAGGPTAPPEGLYLVEVVYPASTG